MILFVGIFVLAAIIGFIIYSFDDYGILKTKINTMQKEINDLKKQSEVVLSLHKAVEAQQNALYVLREEVAELQTKEKEEKLVVDKREIPEEEEYEEESIIPILLTSFGIVLLPVFIVLFIAFLARR